MAPFDTMMILDNGYVYKVLDILRKDTKDPAPRPCYIYQITPKIMQNLMQKGEVYWIPCIEDLYVAAQGEFDFNILINKIETNLNNFGIQFYEFLLTNQRIPIKLFVNQYNLDRKEAEQLVSYCVTKGFLVKDKDGYSAKKNCQDKIDREMKRLVQEYSDNAEASAQLDNDLNKLLNPKKTKKGVSEVEE
jgi:hypothetical protein